MGDHVRPRSGVDTTYREPNPLIPARRLVTMLTELQPISKLTYKNIGNAFALRSLFRDVQHSKDLVTAKYKKYSGIVT
jgi:hypothetical protein